MKSAKFTSKDQNWIAICKIIKENNNEVLIAVIESGHLPSNVWVKINPNDVQVARGDCNANGSRNYGNRVSSPYGGVVLGHQAIAANFALKTYCSHVAA